MSRLAVCEPIACKEANLFEAYALLCPPTSTFYKLLEIERAWLASFCSRVSSWPRGVLVGMRIATWGSVNARKPRSCNTRLPAGKGYGVASASRLSWRRPPAVSLRKRMRSRALTNRIFLTVWSFFLPL